jgi:hypothetical protein
VFIAHIEGVNLTKPKKHEHIEKEVEKIGMEKTVGNNGPRFINSGRKIKG